MALGMASSMCRLVAPPPWLATSRPNPAAMAAISIHSLTPPERRLSGCTISTPWRPIRSAYAYLVYSFSPVAMGISSSRASSAPDSLVQVEGLVRVHHDAPLLAGHRQRRLDAPDVVAQRRAPHLDLNGSEALLESRREGPLELRQIAVALVIPAAHGVRWNAIRVRAQHLVHGQSGGFAQNVPDRDIGSGNGELPQALHALVFGSFPKLRAQALGKRRVFADEDGLHLLLQNRLQHARAAGDGAEGAVRPPGDSGIRVQAQHHPARFRPKAVNRIGEGFAGRKAQQIGLEAGDPHGALSGLHKGGSGHGATRSKEIATVHASILTPCCRQDCVDAT